MFFQRFHIVAQLSLYCDAKTKGHVMRDASHIDYACRTCTIMWEILFHMIVHVTGIFEVRYQFEFYAYHILFWCHNEKNVTSQCKNDAKKKPPLPASLLVDFVLYRAFNIFQVYQYFTIYKQYFLLKFEQFSWISCTTLFKMQRPF